MKRRRFTQILGALATTVVFPISYAVAANYPGGKPVTIVVSTGAGSGTDQTSRQLAQGLSKDFGVPFVIENRTGASGVIGAVHVAKAAPDGHTLLATYAQHYTNQLVRDTPYDALSDFEPLARFANSALVISVAANSPYKTLADVVEAARTNPGAISYGSSGQGTTSHMAAALFSSRADISLNHIPYKTPTQVAVDAAGGQIDLSFNGTTSVLPLIRDGRLRALAVTTSKRTQSLPDVPTVAELGYPGYEVDSALWMFAPRGTSPEIVKQLSDSLLRQMQTKEYKEVCARLGLDIDPQDAATVKANGPAEITKWRKLMEMTGTSKN
ncbi:hypothetical protein TKWG_09235 [Advenella kashmirensis WT001]|uniref:Tripartite tricarboxylate transporter substrate binding protein n=2 Tax=Advenella kashmirensis TaxID=310575 RepID=I3UAY5_ADVKW|nr:hypothetical protein TKWG_09235 [Advenella kashmirensis WT001]